MTDYTNTFTSEIGDLITANGLDTEFNKIVTSVFSKANTGSTAMTGTPTVNGGDVWHQGNQTFANPSGSFGYQIFPNGLIMQWGTGTAAANAVPYVPQLNNYVIPFPNMVGPATAMHRGGLGNGDTCVGFAHVDNSTFTLGSTYSVPIQAWWLVFGV